ncbi:cobalamin B12-binding domain-containing protein [Cereibacter changlensis]|nr:cobalamin-dependent protein [Cereibacter changlensis]PZX49711.1 methanogenic corrinoid protein MtbC1 [Cereibacter changlensis]
MTSGPQGPFDRRLLEQSAFGLTSFKSALPADAVLSLAREVVTRLAGRARELEARDLAAPSRAEIDALCAALTSTDPEAGARFIAGIRREGAALDVIYLAYLASAARRLGEWWDEDRVPSALVTIASSRIYAIMRGLRHVLDPPLDPPPGGAVRAAVFAAVPGETHTLGVTMAADLFRREGWEVELLVGLGHDELIARFAASPAPVLGLSASGARSLVALAKLLLAIRIACPRARVMVCGQIVADAADLVAHLHPEAMANDVPSALAGMQALLEPAPRPS